MYLSGIILFVYLYIFIPKRSREFRLELLLLNGTVEIGECCVDMSFELDIQSVDVISYRDTGERPRVQGTI